MILKVTLNGTDENPWHQWGLKVNPFPKIAKKELVGSMFQLGSLDGDPIKDPEKDIPERLEGWSEEFIQLCIARFEPGKRVSFKVNVPDF